MKIISAEVIRKYRKTDYNYYNKREISHFHFCFSQNKTRFFLFNVIGEFKKYEPRLKFS